MIEDDDEMDISDFDLSDFEENDEVEIFKFDGRNIFWQVFKKRYIEILFEITKKYGKDGLMRMIRIFDIIEDIEIKESKNDRATTKKIR
jgi:hypothetical protein